MRPRVKIPLWVALALPVAAYLLRSLVIRGGDFTLDVPLDVVAFVVFTIGIASYILVRRASLKEDSETTSNELVATDDDEQ